MNFSLCFAIQDEVALHGADFLFQSSASLEGEEVFSEELPFEKVRLGDALLLLRAQDPVVEVFPLLIVLAMDLGAQSCEDLLSFDLG